jgi:predicted RNA binding protein YcfA (HicA-like mRNA interferase family)
MPTAQKIVQWLDAQDVIEYGDSPWRTVSEDEDVFLVDWKRLFPSNRPGKLGENDWDLSGDNWQSDENITPDDDTEGFAVRIRDALENERPSKNEGPGVAERLGWDISAWYQPMHFFGHDWGIFIRRDCIRENAILVARFLPKGTSYSPALLKALLRAGFAALFLHEQFHHKVESLGIRLHVVERASRYVPYKNCVYRPTYGTDDNLEEALADADAYLRTQTSPYSVWMGKSVVSALQAYLRWRHPFDPPGYRMAPKYLTNAKLNRGVDFLHGQVQEATKTPARPSKEWEIATRLHQSLFKVTDHLWEVVPRGYPRSMLPGATPYPSISTRQLIELAEERGWEVEAGATGDRHVRMKHPLRPPLTIPLNRRDLSPGVVKTALKALGYKPADVPGALRRIEFVRSIQGSPNSRGSNGD